MCVMVASLCLCVKGREREKKKMTDKQKWNAAAFHTVVLIAGIQCIINTAVV